MFAEHGDLGWTFYGILYSVLVFGLGFRIQNKRGSVGSAIGLQLFGIFAICIDLYRSLYYLQWLAIPCVAGTLLMEIVLMRRAQRSDPKPENCHTGM
jgi:hypothetical protein